MVIDCTILYILTNLRVFLLFIFFKIISKKLNYKKLFQLKVPISNQEICTKNLTQREIGLFVNSIKKSFIFQMWFDGLPAYGFIGSAASKTGAQGEQYEYYLFTHLHFNFLFNDDRVIYLNITSDTDMSHVVLLDTTKGSCSFYFLKFYFIFIIFIEIFWEYF